MIWNIYEIILIGTAVADKSEEWSLQLISNLSLYLPWEVEALIFQASSFQLLKLEINRGDHSSLSSTTAVQIWIISYILHIISLLTEDMNSTN